MFIWNIQREYMNRPAGRSPMLWGFETARGGWQKLVSHLSQRHINGILSADWSGFDHRALHEVIDDVHSMWRSWFDFDKGYEPSIDNERDYSRTSTDPVRIQRLWDWMTYSVKHTPIVAPSGNIYQWLFNGIASGFQQTQLLDTAVNCAMLLTCLSAVGINIESKDFQMLLQGDDSITTFPERVPKDIILPQLTKEAEIRFNAILSDEKTTYSDWFDGIEVLSYRYEAGFAVREPAELLAHLLYPERPRDLAATADACAGIAAASMGNKFVYDACADIYTYIVDKMQIEPKFKSHPAPIQYERLTTPKFGHFPSYLETVMQNYTIEKRTESDKQQLWPTKPTGTKGFRFLVN